MASVDQLEHRFILLWQRNAYHYYDEVARSVFAGLMDMYTEKWRAYHNIEHIKACLNYFDDCKSHADFADAIEFAIWFHDCIYQLGESDNEAHSRDWFIRQSTGYIVPAVTRHVDRLIMDTRHLSVPDSDDGKLIADIDLTSFGLPWDEYLSDSHAVQAELSLINNGCEVTSKILFLENLVDDGQIYYSDYYLTHFEQKAQDNVQRHLHLLRQP